MPRAECVFFFFPGGHLEQTFANVVNCEEKPISMAVIACVILKYRIMWGRSQRRCFHNNVGGLGVDCIWERERSSSQKGGSFCNE